MPVPHYVTANCPIHKVKYVVASSTVAYIGYSAPGVANSDPLWLIQKMTTVGSDVDLAFAGGKAVFEYVWNDRQSLSYS